MLSLLIGHKKAGLAAVTIDNILLDDHDVIYAKMMKGNATDVLL